MFPKCLALVNGNLDYNLRSDSWWLNFDHPGRPEVKTGPWVRLDLVSELLSDQVELVNPGLE